MIGVWMEGGREGGRRGREERIILLAATAREGHPHHPSTYSS